MSPPLPEARSDRPHADDLDVTALVPFLGEPLPTGEAAMWSSMSTERRAKALRRMEALAKWDDGNGPLTPADAAIVAGVSLNRFFEMAKGWREHRSLAALGTFAKSSRRPDAREAALQEIVGEVLGRWPTGSVRRMAADLGEAWEVKGGKPVGQSMLRRVVEHELRRRDAEGQPGADVQFDCSACSLLRPDGAPHTLFAVVDRGTQLVFGAAVGDVADSRAGYAAASLDALKRLGAGEFDQLPWAPRSLRFELVVGLDADRWIDLRDEMAASGVAAPIERSTRSSRFGRYLKRSIGDRLGRIDMWYGRTVPQPNKPPKVADRSPRLATADANAFLAAQVDEHRDERRQHFREAAGAVPPVDLIRILEGLAAG